MMSESPAPLTGENIIADTAHGGIYLQHCAGWVPTLCPPLDAMHGGTGPNQDSDGAEGFMSWGSRGVVIRRHLTSL